MRSRGGADPLHAQAYGHAVQAVPRAPSLSTGPAPARRAKTRAFDVSGEAPPINVLGPLAEARGHQGDGCDPAAPVDDGTHERLAKPNEPGDKDVYRVYETNALARRVSTKKKPR
jgi:hypothetical protein